MTEHLSDGKFAPKDVTEEPAVEVTRNNGRFKKGVPRPANAGRKKGTPNRITREVKEWMRMAVNKVSLQDGVESKIERGDTVAFFRMLEHVIGKPKEVQDVNLSGKVLVGWLEKPE